MSTTDRNRESLLPIGTLLQMGKYRIDRYLSSGGFGNTYVITNLQFDEQFAMKEFFMKGINERDNDSTTVSVSNKDNHQQFEQQREKFKKEARRLRKLDNPHIVHVHDLFDENGTTYYVMDLIEGQSVSSLMKQKKKPLPENKALDIVQQVLDALAVVHKEGIWHLDIKPGNIMLDKSNNAILIDFGASKQISTSEGYTSTSSAMCYTPGYAPSEQIDQNMERIGPWTDFYALGATLYNIVTCNQPPSVSEIIDGGTFAFPAPISTVTQQLIQWMMMPNRQKRPQTVNEIIRFLERNDGRFNKSYKREELQIKEVSLSEETEYHSKTTKGNSKLSNISIEKKSIHKKGKSVIPKKNVTFTEHYLQRKYIVIFVVAAFLLSAVIFGVYSINNNTVASSNHNLTESKLSPPKAANELELSNRIDSICKLSEKAIALYNTVRFHSGEMSVSSKECKSSLGQYLYTGPTDEDGIPNGIGVADFTDGRLYIGPFYHGRIQGDAFFRYDNGDTFEGDFTNESKFGKGKYTIWKDESYFEGTFKNGAPFEGQWFDKNGSLIETISKSSPVKQKSKKKVQKGNKTMRIH